MTVSARSSAPAAVVWELLSRPDRWREWAPHLRGARGLGAPRVSTGSRGSVSLLGAPVPAAITAVVPGSMWAWRVGPLRVEHRVEPEPEGSRISFTFEAPEPLALALRFGYGPLTGLLARNLARVAEREAGAGARLRGRRRG